MKRYSWTQPQCFYCFTATNPGRLPVRVVDAVEEVCVSCNAYTTDGIYIRIDPTTARYPTLEKD